MKLFWSAFGTLSMGLILASGTAHAQNQPQEVLIPQYTTHKPNSGTPHLTYPPCNCGHQEETLKYMNKTDRLKTYLYLMSDCSCTNCGTFWSEFHYVWGSCGEFYCSERKRDLVTGRPLMEAAKSYFPLYPELSAIPFPDVIMPFPPDSTASALPGVPRALPASRPRTAPAVQPARQISQVPAPSGLTVYRIVPKRTDGGDDATETATASTNSLTRCNVQTSSR
jgi:hypothetical protein